MKTRQGFVSNSSSASFIVSLEKITAKDALKLMDYDKLPADAMGREWKDGWDIEVDFTKGLIHGCAIMDNGDLSEYLIKENVNISLFVWKHD